MRAQAAVLIADDHPLFREAIRSIVGAVVPEARFVEASGSFEMLSALGHDEKFDLVFVDLVMPGLDPFEALALVRGRVPGARAVVVSSREDWPTIRRALALGVAGYIPKSTPRSGIEAAIRQVVDGGTYVPEHVADADHAPFKNPEALTERQHAVLEQLALGLSNRQIATKLGIEEITVKVHISAILRKLHVKNRTQAVVAARSLLA
ncbi:MAG: LuxR C-terminal-related transcriptional regulator [Vulcanimicrobiaceae bacterium]